MSTPQPSTPKQQPLRIGIDIGGTFTDFVIFDPASGKIDTFKLPSTPHDPAQAVILGLNKIGIDSQFTDLPINIIHGSTVATNALLERKGAHTALITTRGFKDVLQIGRQNRPDLYNFGSQPIDPLVPSELRFELGERVDFRGEILTPLDDAQVDTIIAQLTKSQTEIESVAVVFLFSFLHPEHEQRVTEKLRQRGFFTSASHEILPEYREYERTSTTVVNAYVSPILDRYLQRLGNDLKNNESASQRINASASQQVDDSTHQQISKSQITTLQIMQSNGGSISVDEARKSGVRCILSGPAGGVVGCQFVGEMAKYRSSQSPNQQSSTPKLRLLTFDMGGTSTDVSLIEGMPKVTSESEVGGHPIRIPILDIHTIGAGGGSIASIDAGSALRVGPESAGADPGPACYGKSLSEAQGVNYSMGSQIAETANHAPLSRLTATVTDANLQLGRIPPDHFLGGKMPLYPELAEQALRPLAEQLNLSITQTALGIVEIANAHMERALRVISVERGHDPRHFTLLSFGGAGGLHAADLARRLHIPKVLVPPFASTLSAFGMLAADVVKDYTQTVMLPGDTPIADLRSAISPLLGRGQKEIAAEGFIQSQIRLEPALDMRYLGQSYELTIPFSENFLDNFHESHRQTYGYLRPEANLEIVNLRVRATGVVSPPQIETQPQVDADPSAAQFDARKVILASGEREIPLYRGESLQPGHLIHGPAIVVRSDTTILIGANDQANVDPFLNLLIEIDSQNKATS